MQEPIAELIAARNKMAEEKAAAEVSAELRPGSSSTEFYARSAAGGVWYKTKSTSEISQSGWGCKDLNDDQNSRRRAPTKCIRKEKASCALWRFGLGGLRLQAGSL